MGMREAYALHGAPSLVRRMTAAGCKERCICWRWLVLKRFSCCVLIVLLWSVRELNRMLTERIRVYSVVLSFLGVL